MSPVGACPGTAPSGEGASGAGCGLHSGVLAFPLEISFFFPTTIKDAPAGVVGEAALTRGRVQVSGEGFDTKCERRKILLQGVQHADGPACEQRIARTPLRSTRRARRLADPKASRALTASLTRGEAMAPRDPTRWP